MNAGRFPLVHWPSLMLGLLGGIAVGLLAGYFWLFRPPPLVLAVPTPVPLPPTPTPAPVHVYVSGAVAIPGVYTLPVNSRVEDAVRAAGGFAADADREGVNLALSVRDGDHVHIPRRGETASTKTKHTSAARAAPASPVDVNRATLAELEAIPGIGHVMAQRIVAHRPYGNVEDLLHVPGIGPATLAKIRPYVTVEDEGERK